MKGLIGIVAVAMLMTATGALAEEPQSGETTPKEKKICKSEKITGSLTRVRRVCLTQAQWDEMAASTNRALDRMSRSANQAEALTTRTQPGAGGGPPPGGGHTF